MGVRFPGVGITQPLASQLGINTLTAILTSTPLNISLDFQQVIIMGMYMFTPGAGATSVTFRIHNGPTAASGQITQWTLPVTAGITNYTSFCYPHTPGAVAGMQYT